MKKRTDRGIFITVEGGDGTGKSTLVDKLYEYLAGEKKLFVVKTFEPGGTSFGKECRKLLLNSEETLISSRAELLLYLADRAQHVETLIKPALEQDMIVLCDRFTDSSLAYQGVARMLGRQFERFEDVCLFAAADLTPDVTFYLDIDPAIALKRLGGDKDRLESENLSFHRMVRTGYLKLAEENPNRIHTIDASQSPEAVYEQVVEKLSKYVKVHA